MATCDQPREGESRWKSLILDLKATEVMQNLPGLLDSLRGQSLGVLVLFDKNTVNRQFHPMILAYHLHQASKKLLQPLRRAFRCHHCSFRMFSSQQLDSTLWFSVWSLQMSSLQLQDTEQSTT